MVRPSISDTTSPIRRVSRLAQVSATAGESSADCSR